MKIVDTLRGHDVIGPFWQKWHDKAKFCGGFVRYMATPNFTGEKEYPGDIDIYPNSFDDMGAIQNDLYGLFKYEQAFDSIVATSYKRKEKDIKIQIIKPVNQGAVVAHGDLETILNSFDFTVVCAGLIELGKAKVHDDFLDDELKKRLSIMTIHCPISSVKRIAKYSSRGYYISPTEIRKLYEDWDKRIPEYKEELDSGLAALANNGGDMLSLDDGTRGSLLKILYTD